MSMMFSWDRGCDLSFLSSVDMLSLAGWCPSFYFLGGSLFLICQNLLSRICTVSK